MREMAGRESGWTAKDARVLLKHEHLPVIIIVAARISCKSVEKEVVGR